MATSTRKISGMAEIRRHFGNISESEAMKHVVALKLEGKASNVTGQWVIEVEVEEEAGEAPETAPQAQELPPLQTRADGADEDDGKAASKTGGKRR